MALAFQLLKMRLFGGELLVQAPDRTELGVDAIDLACVRAAEIAVVDEQAAGARRILLIEKKLQGLNGTDEIGGAQLAREVLAGARQIRLMAVLLLCEHGTPRGALRVL